MSLIAAGIGLAGSAIGAGIGNKKGKDAADEQNALEQQNWQMQYQNQQNQREFMNQQNSQQMMQTYDPAGATQKYWQNGGRAPLFYQNRFQSGGQMGPFDIKSYPGKVRMSRKGTRKNKDGSESTVLMSSSDNKAFPMLFENEDGSWKEFEKDDWRSAMDYAKEKGELYEFTSPEEANSFAEGSWKNAPVDMPGENWTAPKGPDNRSKTRRVKHMKDGGVTDPPFMGMNPNSLAAVLSARDESMANPTTSEERFYDENPRATGEAENSFDPITFAVMSALAPVSLPIRAATRLGKAGKFVAETLNPLAGMRSSAGSLIKKNSVKAAGKNVKKAVSKVDDLDDKLVKLDIKKNEYNAKRQIREAELEHKRNVAHYEAMKESDDFLKKIENMSPAEKEDALRIRAGYTKQQWKDFKDRSTLRDVADDAISRADFGVPQPGGMYADYIPTEALGNVPNPKNYDKQALLEYIQGLKSGGGNRSNQMGGYTNFKNGGHSALSYQNNKPGAQFGAIMSLYNAYAANKAKSESESAPVDLSNLSEEEVDQYFRDNRATGEVEFDAATQLSLGSLGAGAVGKGAPALFSQPGRTAGQRAANVAAEIVNPLSTKSPAKSAAKKAGSKAAKSVTKDLAKTEAARAKSAARGATSSVDDFVATEAPLVRGKSTVKGEGISGLSIDERRALGYKLEMQDRVPYDEGLLDLYDPRYGNRSNQMGGYTNYKQGGNMGRNLLQMVQAGNPQAYWPKTRATNANNPGNVGRHRNNMDHRYPGSSQNFEGGGDGMFDAFSMENIRQIPNAFGDMIERVPYLTDKYIIGNENAVDPIVPGESRVSRGFNEQQPGGQFDQQSAPQQSPYDIMGYKKGGNLLQRVQSGDTSQYWMNNSPNNANNPGNVGRHRDNMDPRYYGSSQNQYTKGFQVGGNMYDTLQDIGYDEYAEFAAGGMGQGMPAMPAEGGQLQPISDNSVEVQGNNPNAVDSVDVGNAMVDPGEMIKDLPQEPGQRVYSDTLKPPGSKETFAEIAKKLEKQKHPDKPEQNERIEYKLNELFEIQQTMNGDSHGENPAQAAAGGMDPSAAQNAGKPIAQGGARGLNVQRGHAGGDPSTEQEPFDAYGSQWMQEQRRSRSYGGNPEHRISDIESQALIDSYDLEENLMNEISNNDKMDNTVTGHRDAADKSQIDILRRKKQSEFIQNTDDDLQMTIPERGGEGDSWDPNPGANVVTDYDADWDYKMEGDKIYTKKKKNGSRWRDVSKTAAGKAIYNDVFVGHNGPTQYEMDKTKVENIKYEPGSFEPSAGRYDMNMMLQDKRAAEDDTRADKYAILETLQANGFSPDEFFNLPAKERRKLEKKFFGRKLSPGDLKRVSSPGSVTQKDIEAAGISLDDFYGMKRKDRKRFEKENFGNKLRMRDLNAIARDSKYQGGMIKYQGGGYTDMNQAAQDQIEVPYPGGRKKEPSFVPNKPHGYLGMVVDPNAPQQNNIFPEEQTNADPYNQKVAAAGGMFGNIGKSIGNAFKKPTGGGMSSGVNALFDGAAEGVSGGLNTFGNSYTAAYGRDTNNPYMGAMGTIGNVGQFGQSAGELAKPLMNQGKPGAQYGGDMDLEYAYGGRGGFDYRHMGPPDSFNMPMSMLSVARRFPTPANVDLDYLQRQAGGSWGKFDVETNPRRESKEMGRSKRKHNDDTPNVSTRRRVKKLAIPSKKAMHEARGNARGKKGYQMGGWLMPSVPLNKRSLTLSLLR